MGEYIWEKLWKVEKFDRKYMLPLYFIFVKLCIFYNIS